MTYEEWEAGVPEPIRKDPLWKVEAYRIGLFLSDLAWHDVTAMLKDRRTLSVTDQLFRAAGNISSNIAEGYSRSTAMDRARFYEYASGSARESRDWYYKGRRVLKPEVVDHRIELCTQIVRLTITMIIRERRANRRIARKD